MGIIWLWVALLVLGFVVLVVSASYFVDAAKITAHYLGVSELIIGLTAVSIGTSAPEILIAITDSYTESPDTAIGNAIGSNIANIGLVLGLTAIVVPLPFEERVLRSELPMLLVATCITAFCLANLYVGPVDGLILLAFLGYILYRLVRDTRTTGELPEEIESEVEDLERMSPLRAWIQLAIGLVFLSISAKVIVSSAEHIAAIIGVPEMLVGLTVVAAGTSLPELAATMAAALRRSPEIAIGNIVGSNILNILAVLSVPALLSPSSITPIDFWRDFGVMFILTMLLALFANGIGAKKVITRCEGVVFLASYCCYIVLVYWQDL